MPKNKFLPLLFCVSLLMLLNACGEEEKKVPDVKSVPIVIKKDKPNKSTDLPKSAPIINITDTVAARYHLIYIKDSAINSARLSQKLGKIFGEKLGDAAKKLKVKPSGPPMAWYKSQKAPFFFEAAIPVEKKPSGKLPKGILYKAIGGDSAIVAHYFGPYEETGQAYEALKEWLKDNKKKSKSPPYEIYVGDPIDEKGNPRDPYKVQTDIIFPHN